jgi:hypothetical protein
MNENLPWVSVVKSTQRKRREKFLFRILCLFVRDEGPPWHIINHKKKFAIMRTNTQFDTARMNKRVKI